MSHVFHRHCQSLLPTISHGRGAYLYDTRGKKYLDACGGAAVSNLGHNNAQIKHAIQNQMDNIPYAHTGFFTSQVAEDLAHKLSSLAPEPLNYVYFTSGGSEAVEAALKVARQYFLEQGKSEKTQFIARHQSYHGNTLGALSVGGNHWRRDPFKAIMSPSHHINPCYPYRFQEQDETNEAYALRSASELETSILKIGPENVMAFVAEPIVGATSGAVVPSAGYFSHIRKICDKYDVLLILDEVMCGVGRSGRFFAFEYEDITPDIVTVAKGLGAGYQPIGATLVSSKIHNAIAQGSGFFQHGHTFMGHPMACAASLATINYIQQHDLTSRVTKLGEDLRSKLQDTFGHRDYIGEIRGRGLFIGIELVEDKESKQPHKPSHQLAKKLKATAMDEGLMIYPMGGTIDGTQGNHILLAPPFIIDDAQSDEIVDKLNVTLQKVMRHIGEG
ncbi:aspartate aminotransferase family protein [Vibrio sp. ZSDE26]|uniref:Aspartate aminotransferase family protein n=1 Tax=Vibrio amylolyticus TaxID=2847292 RepID=A0A9X1XL09_9VIBR|nr:aspartate aminotransferase family protein [Vibrio amylolyticus]MCK6264661.1 aspartate aminotransferase family protein [Vibrio amylolyticus]